VPWRPSSEPPSRNPRPPRVALDVRHSRSICSCDSPSDVVISSALRSLPASSAANVSAEMFEIPSTPKFCAGTCPMAAKSRSADDFD
jgi:hypothetical protein